jgi:hypothetical protein
MSEFNLQRLGILMEPEPGNPQEVEGVLNPAAARGRDGELYLFPRWSRRGITRASALRECGSMKRAIRQASSGSASHCSRKPIMSGGPTAAVAARILVSRSWNPCSAT